MASAEPPSPSTDVGGAGFSGSRKVPDIHNLNALRVKPEFVLTERSSVLAPLPPAPPPEAKSSSGDDRQGSRGSDDDRKNQSNRRRNKRGKKGMNKKRPRDARIGDADKACSSVLRGEECPFGAEKCKYSHDLRAILSKRPPDIAEVEGGCPRYNSNGYCDFGVMCRLGSCHINQSTGQNLRKPDCEMASDSPAKEEVMNVLRKEVQFQLRKKKYPFVCKRYCEVDNDDDAGRRDKGDGGDSKDKSSASVAESDSSSKVVISVNDNNVEGKQLGKADNVLPEAKSFETTVSKEAGGAKADDRSDGMVVEKTTVVPSSETKSPKAATGSGTISSEPDLCPLPTKRKLIDFRNKVYVAPLTTVGNLPFRRIMKKFGADITCGEMAVVQNLLEGKSSEWALLKRHREEDVFGVQIATGYVDQVTRISEVFENENVAVDFVDLNMGCPLDLICDKGSGAALMLRERRLKAMLRAMTSTLSCPVTVKMRTAWDERDPLAHKLVPKIQRWGIDGISAIMIHGRSRHQRYQKLADWDFIAQCAASQNPDLPQIPIIGNGDIFSYSDYEEKMAREGVNATAMIARGALIKPWLPTEIKERRHWDISASERLDMLKEFVRFGLEHWGSDQQGVDNTRRFLLEWLSFLYRYVPCGMLEVLPQQMNQRPPYYLCGRNDLETLMMSKQCVDWIKISEMLLGPVPDGFRFQPKHKASGYA